MIQWKLKINFLNILLSYTLIFKIKADKYTDLTIEPGIVQMKYLNDGNKKSFIFNDEGINNDLLVNFYSFSCNVELSSFTKQNISVLDLNGNIISMRIKNNSFETVGIIMKEVPNLINGINKYTKKKNCPVIINAIEYGNFTLLVEEKAPTILFFGEKYMDRISLSYKINDSIKLNGFITVSISFNEVSTFNINIPDIIDINISNSTNIFLDSDSLKNINGDILHITISHLEKQSSCILTFQIIEPESIYILQRDYINKGFISSNYKYQYYFMEVFQEEGEIMLHNKRHSGKLFGSIKSKNGFNPYKISEYKKLQKNTLEFNEHTQKLRFNSEHTKNCKKGCYLILAYYNENFNKERPIIGYEYTLLARIWDVDDYIPQIINIPFNEYIFGTFEENSFINHYYAIKIPKEIKEIIIQIDSNYIEGFIGEGKKKLITFKNTQNNLNLTDKEMIIKFDNNSSKDFIGKEISFAFRAKNFFEDTFSSYHFRILILKENDNNLIYPLDSNIGNICLPEKDKNKVDSYYCYALLSNNYNEFSLNFSVSNSNQKDNYNITLYKNYTEEENIYTKYYIGEFKEVKDLQLILFKFEFENNQPKTILSMFSDDKDKYSPKIYSSKIYTLFNSKKEFNINFIYGKCLLIFKYIKGSGTISFDDYPKIEANLNYLGKTITIPISEEKKITFNTEETFTYILQLMYLKPKSDIKELFFDESLNELLLDTQFPIYYYIKYENQDNIDINFRIINIEDVNTTTYIFINGYIIDNQNLERMQNGEFIELTESIVGQYDKNFKNGLLQINKTIINNKYFKNDKGDSDNSKEKYILIKIDGKHYISNSISIEIIAMSNNNGKYLVPANQYIMGYNLFNNIIYLIKTYEIENKNTYIIVEFSSNYLDLNLYFNNSTDI